MQDERHDWHEISEMHTEAGTLLYRRVNRHSGDARPTIVFVHGLLFNGLLWRKVVPRVGEHFDCVTPDLPMGAHHRSMERNAILDPPSLAVLVADLVENLGVGPVVLVGNDTGGAICQLVAAQRPELVEAMVLTNCDTHENFLPPVFRPLKWMGFVPGGVWTMLQSMRLKALWRLPLAYGLIQKSAVDPAVIDAYFRVARKDKMIRRDASKVLRAISPRYTLDAATKLKDFQRPVLLAWAIEDRAFPIKFARRMANDMPNAEVLEIIDSFALVPEDQPEVLADAIVRFVAEVSPSEEVAPS